MPSAASSPLAAPLAVVVVAASSARVSALRVLLGSVRFRVVAEASTPLLAQGAVSRERPDVVLVDLDAAGVGLEALERIMSDCPTPVVVCGTRASEARVAAAALAAGAVDVVGALDAPPSSGQYAVALRRHVEMASRMRVIRHPRSRLRGLSPAPVQSPQAIAVARAAAVRATRLPVMAGSRHTPSPLAVEHLVGRARLQPRVVLIGASTGGPPALRAILGELPVTLGVPVLVVQHMADGFVDGLAEWLDSISSLPVSVGRDGERLLPGHVYLAPSGCNTVLRSDLTIEAVPPEPGQFSVPGIDATFASAAMSLRGRAVAVLLTGMGRDGAAGLRHLRSAGATTLAQDEATSVVWGMPAAALALDAVDVELALGDVAAALTLAVLGPQDPLEVDSPGVPA